MGPAGDRSWTITPTLLWFGTWLIAGLLYLDHDVDAIANRLTAPRTAGTVAAGPTFTAKPVEIAEASEEPEDKTPPPKPIGDRGHIGALEDVCVDGDPTACKRWGMDGYYRAVGESKAGTLGHAVRVSWYGDSVIATDAIPGRLRAKLQGELGDGGPGFVYAVPPHRFCGHDAITRSTTGTWRPHAISTLQIPDGLYGVGGSTAETEDGRSVIKLVAGKATRVELYLLTQPHGGIATLTADGTEVLRADTKGDAPLASYATASVPDGAKKFEIGTQGRVRLFGLDLENATGAVVDNLGVVSVNVKSFAVNDAAHFVAEVDHRGADLIMIMIGANEAQWLGPTDRDTKDYAAHYEKVLAPLRKARPDGACLVVSPTDQAEAKDGEFPSRPVMPLLVEAQRKAAHAQGCAFYSTYDWMGGKGSAAKWYQHGLVGSDFQHLSRKGANKLADAIYDALVAGYQSYAIR